MDAKKKSKKIIFAVDKNSFTNPDHAGVNIKVASQIEQMKQNGNEARLLQYTWQDGELMIDVDEDTDVLYFRRIESSIKLIKTLKRCKIKSPKLKIVMEIPTYPFVGERGRRSLKQTINNIVGDILLKRYVDRIVLCGVIPRVEKVVGIPTLNFSNGIDANKIPVNKYIGNSDEIHMICVSGCMLSHGYDRMIEGLNNYYQNKPSRKVYFHIVGTGDYYDKYVELAKKYGLYEKYVIFHGRQTGDALDKIYEQCNLAVAHLAAHRVGLNIMSSLKSREYAIRGIPFISSTIFDFSNINTDKYIHYVPADEKPIDVEAVIGFFDMVYEDNNVSDTIRGIFGPLCAWENTFFEVIDYINK